MSTDYDFQMTHNFSYIWHTYCVQHINDKQTKRKKKILIQIRSTSPCPIYFPERILQITQALFSRPSLALSNDYLINVCVHYVHTIYVHPIKHKYVHLQ
jgi:hypothetical protein